MITFPTLFVRQAGRYLSKPKSKPKPKVEIVPRPRQNIPDGQITRDGDQTWRWSAKHQQWFYVPNEKQSTQTVRVTNNGNRSSSSNKPSRQANKPQGQTGRSQRQTSRPQRTQQARKPQRRASAAQQPRQQPQQVNPSNQGNQAQSYILPDNFNSLSADKQAELLNNRENFYANSTQQKLSDRGLIDRSQFSSDISIETNDGKPPVVSRVYDYTKTDNYDNWESQMWSDPTLPMSKSSNNTNPQASATGTWIGSYLDSPGYNEILNRPDKPIQYDPSKVSPDFIADLFKLRYNLYKSGIYDSRSGDWFTRDKLMQYIQSEQEKGNYIIDNNLFKNFSTDEIVDILNSVAYNGSTGNIDISVARHGRLIQRRKFYNI